MKEIQSNNTQSVEAQSPRALTREEVVKNPGAFTTTQLLRMFPDQQGIFPDVDELRTHLDNPPPLKLRKITIGRFGLRIPRF